MHLDQLLSVTRQVCKITDKQELKAMLNLYHDLGVIVKHGQTVVLQAQWLIDLFKQVTTVPPFDRLVSIQCYTQSCYFFVRFSYKKRLIPFRDRFFTLGKKLLTHTFDDIYF